MLPGQEADPALAHPLEGHPGAGARNINRAGLVRPVDFDMEAADRVHAADQCLDGVAPRRRYIDRVLQPFAGLEIVDCITVRIRADDVDVLIRPIHTAGVVRHQVVIRETLAAIIEILGFDLTGYRGRRS